MLHSDQQTSKYMYEYLSYNPINITTISTSTLNVPLSVPASDVTGICATGAPPPPQRGTHLMPPSRDLLRTRMSSRKRPAAASSAPSSGDLGESPTRDYKKAWLAKSPAKKAYFDVPDRGPGYIPLYFGVISALIVSLSILLVF